MASSEIAGVFKSIGELSKDADRAYTARPAAPERLSPVPCALAPVRPALCAPAPPAFPLPALRAAAACALRPAPCDLSPSRATQSVLAVQKRVLQQVVEYGKEDARLTKCIEAKMKELHRKSAELQARGLARPPRGRETGGPPRGRAGRQELTIG